jgi:hypothetical protein
MPDLFEVHEYDCQLLDDAQRTIRREILVAYWRSNCEIKYKHLPVATKRTAKAIDAVFELCPGLDVVDGLVHHQRYSEEFVRMLKVSKRAKKAASIRWAQRDTEKHEAKNGAADESQ